MIEHKIKHDASQIRLYAVQVSHFSNNDQNIFMRLTFNAYPHLYFICFICTSSPQLNNFFQESVCPASDDSFGKVPSMDDDRAQNKALCQSDKAMQYK